MISVVLTNPGSCSDVPLCTDPVPFASDATICEGQPINLASLLETDGGGETVTYHTSQGDANTGNAPLTSTVVSPTVTTTYYVRSEITVMGTTCFGTDDFNIMVNGNPAIMSMDVEVCENDDAVFRTTFSSPTAGGAINYQWSLSTDAGVTFNEIPGATADSLLIPMVGIAFDGNQYRVDIDESSGTVNCTNSTTASLAVNPLPECIIDGPRSVAANEQDVVFNGPAGAGLTYMWNLMTDGASVIDGPADQQSVTVDINDSEDILLLLTVVDDNNCEQSCELLFLPQVLFLGSTVFEDTNNNGVQDPGESGLPNVPIELVDVSTGNILLVNTDGSFDQTFDDNVETIFTDASGNYLYSNLPPGDYIVQIPSAAFLPEVDNALDTLTISSNSLTSGFTEVDPDDGNVDGDDNGIQAPGAAATMVASQPVTLSIGDEPLNTDTETAQGNLQDDAMDENGNMTVDFGFFAPVTVAGIAFIDVNGDGIQDAGDEPTADVNVFLYDATTDSPVLISADLQTYDPIMTTGPDGSYSFTNLPPGDYYVVFETAAVPNGELYDFTDFDVGPDNDLDSDAQFADPSDESAPSETTGFLSSGEMELDLDAGLLCAISTMVPDDIVSCAGRAISLVNDATIVPASLDGLWTTTGDGVFLDSDGNELTGPNALWSNVVAYLPGDDDRASDVILTLTTTDPGTLMPPSPCEPVSSSFTVSVLNNGCTGFFWDGQ